MKVLNKDGNTINVLHFCGKSILDYPKTIELIKNNTVLNPIENLNIISCWTDDNKCILLQQLNKFNIPLINAIEYKDIKYWHMPNKICYILYALINKTSSDIVMILDGYDVLLSSTDNLIERFKSQPYRILFNASPHNYPDEQIDIIPNRESLGHYKYFNAGCCIGYKNDLIKFYSQVLAYIDIPNQNCSEQRLLRWAFSNYSANENQRFIGIDNNNLIFNIMSKTLITYKDNVLKISPLNEYEDFQRIVQSKY